MEIEWRQVVGYEGLYEVSSEGDIRGLKRGKVLNPSEDEKGYLYVALSKEGKVRPTRVHSIVASAFFGPLPRGLHTRHRNGVKKDNRKCNLVYGTVEENAMDNYNNGLYSKRPITVEGKQRARQLLAQGKTQVEIAELLGVGVNSVFTESKRMRRELSAQR